MSKSKQKPKKPRSDFPLFAHQNGQWAKKIRGKLHYFGPWSDPEAALTEYLRIRDDLQAGRTPTPAAGVVNLADMINAFLEDADQRRAIGELSALSFRDYRWTGEQIVAHFGRTVAPERIRPSDFAAFRHKLAAKYAPSRLAKTVTVSRMMFRWAFETELIDVLPRFGPGFKATSKRAARAAKAQRGDKLFAADEVRRLINETEGAFAAMILLAANGGLGNTDLSMLPTNAIDLCGGWITFPRPKTGVARRVPLWPESVAAMQDVLNQRPQPQREELADRVFLTSRGGEWVVVTDDGKRVDKITIRFRNLLKATSAYEKGRGFYSLRHLFQTVGDEAGDPIATSHIMGHVDASTDGHYRERISDERLRRVTDYVRQWLFDKADTQPAEAPQLRVVG